MHLIGWRPSATDLVLHTLHMRVGLAIVDPLPARWKGKRRALLSRRDDKSNASPRRTDASRFSCHHLLAFKQSETERDGDTASTGWETFLAAVIEAGFAVSGTWPMRSELATRNVGRDTNALASSIVLVCRPRPDNAPTATRPRVRLRAKGRVAGGSAASAGQQHCACRPRAGGHWPLAWPSIPATPRCSTPKAIPSLCATRWRSSTPRSTRHSPNKKVTSMPTAAGPSRGSSRVVSPKAITASPKLYQRPRTWPSPDLLRAEAAFWSPSAAKCGC